MPTFAAASSRSNSWIRAFADWGGSVSAALEVPQPWPFPIAQWKQSYFCKWRCGTLLNLLVVCNEGLRQKDELIKYE
jgi:hypothetical protein